MRLFMGTGKVVFLLVVMSLLYAPVAASPNYTGTTGLIWTPDARIMEVGEMRFTFSINDPFSDNFPRTFAANAAFLPFFEIGGRLVEYDNDELVKYKVPDLKIRILKERGNLPAIAVGVSDFEGSQDNFAEYIALSKMFGDFDVTVGFGGDLFGLKSSGVEKRYLDGFFAGIEWHMRDDLSLMVEYDPTKKAAFHQDDDDFDNLNLGIRWKPHDWLEFGYAYQRGDHGMHVALSGNFNIEDVLPYRLLDRE